MGLINTSNGNYIKVTNVQVTCINDYFRTIVEFNLYKNHEQRLTGPAEFETYYLKQLEVNDFVFTDEKGNPYDNIKTGAYYLLRKNGFDDQNWDNA